MRNIIPILFSTLYLSLVIGCGEVGTPQKRGEIIFGDSSTIVTESDERYLRNNVEDLVPQKAVLEAQPPVAKPQPGIDTAKAISEKPLPAQDNPPASAKMNGLLVPFENLQVLIKDVKGSSSKKIDWKKARGASFNVEQVDLNGKSLSISGSTVTRVLQKYQTVVLIKAADGKLFKLSALPVSSDGWKTLKGNNGKYLLSGLGNNELNYTGKFSPNALRNAIHRLARATRMSKKDEDKMLKSVKSVRNARQAPLSIALQSVIWKISAKDPSGKIIERELRIDINR